MAPVSLRKGLVDVLAGELIKKELQIENESEENFKVAMQYTMSNFRFHRFLDVDPVNVKHALQGLASKFRVHALEDKARHLERLVVRFLDQPLLDSRSKDDVGPVQTDAHFALLSLLMNLSDSPLHSDYVPGLARQKEQEKENIDWKAFLLDGEDSPELGVPYKYLDKKTLDDSDDEIWKIESCQEEEVPYDDHIYEDIADIRRILIPQTTNTDSKKQEMVWMSANIIQSYWKESDATPFELHDFTYSRRYGDICKNWEVWKMQRSHRRDLTEKKVLTEKLVVRETLWMLQGVTQLYVYPMVDGKYTVNSNIVLTHMTQETLLSYLQTFTNVGSKIAELKQFSEAATSGDKTVSKTFAAFAFTVRRYLMERNAALAALEKAVIDEDFTVTLSVLTEKLVLDSSRTFLIYELYINAVVKGEEMISDEVSATAADNGSSTWKKSLDVTQRLVYFLDIFYEYLCSFDALGDAGLDKVSILLPMFLDTCQSYLDDIDHWMSTGELPYSSDGEFFIYRSGLIQKGEANYWSETFKIKEKQINGEVLHLVPTFLQTLEKKILLAGKSLGLLQEFGNFTACLLSRYTLFEEFKHNLKKAICETNDRFLKGADAIDGDHDRSSARLACAPLGTQAPLLRMNFEKVFLNNCWQICKGQRRNVLLPESENWKEILRHGSCRPPLASLFKKSLFPLIVERYDKASTVLLDLMKKEWKLASHLQVMKNFFLMEEGGTMHMFYSEVFLKAKQNQLWQDVPYLNIALQDALQLHFPSLMGLLTVGLKSSSVPTSKVNMFDGLSLHYKAPWPITIVLDVQSERRYNELFSFLLKMKRAIWCLEQLRFHELTALPNEDGDSSLEEIDEGESIRLAKRNELVLDKKKLELRQLMLILRMKISHVLKTLHFYVMNRVQYTTCSEFELKVSEAKDLDEILKVHHDFLDALHQRCFLVEKVSSAGEAILRIFKLAFDFQDLWMASVVVVDEVKLKQVEDEFNRYKSFLLSFFTSLAKRGSYPHFEYLASTLKTEAHSHLAVFRRAPNKGLILS